MDAIRLIILLVLLISLVIPIIIIFIVVRGTNKATFENVKLEERDKSIFKYVKNTNFSEIAVLYRYFNKIKCVVYSDHDNEIINDEDFSFINDFRVKKMFKVADVIKNGSRFWAIDEIEDLYEARNKNILGYTMREFTFVITDKDTVSNKTTYNKLNVELNFGYKILKGSTRYQLINEENETFTMISASRVVDSSINKDNLHSYMEKVYLPKGWQIKISETEEDIIYNIRKKTFVVEDAYQNIYLMDK
ncbi:MAG: hypothetical protein ACRCYE_05545 [Sarcina sp.]